MGGVGGWMIDGIPLLSRRHVGGLFNTNSSVVCDDKIFLFYFVCSKMGVVCALASL